MDSDDYSTDENRRKREAQDEVKGFSEGSKKTSRTPIKEKYMEESKLDQMLKIIKDMKIGQNEIKNEIQQMRTEQNKFNEEIKKLKEDNETLKKENIEIKKDNKRIMLENNNTKADLENMKKTVDWMEKEKIKNNVVLKGLVMKTNNTDTLKEEVSKFIENRLQIDVEVSAVNKIGERMCIIEMKNDKDKTKVMQNKMKLKDLKTEKIFIQNDLTKKEREQRRQIWTRAKEERDNGKTVQIGYNRIFIDGIEWRWNKIECKLEQKTKNQINK